MSEANQHQPGTKLCGRVILRVLGSGGAGSVYLAEGSDGPVAIKVFHPSVIRQDPDFEKKLFREGQLACRINHPNVVNVLDACRAPETGDSCLVMEFVEGGNASTLLEKEGRLDWEWACLIALRVAEALCSAAAIGIIHRDIKPDNIMITASGAVKLADLGIAKQSTEQGNGRIQGTPAYISPEQTRKDGKIDCRTDIYCLGATLYQLLTGKLPFEGKSALELLIAAQESPVPDPRRLRPEIPAPVAELVMQMMAKDPQKRPATPYQLARRLRVLLQMDRGARGALTKTVQNHFRKIITEIQLQLQRDPVLIQLGVVLFLLLLLALFLPATSNQVPKLPLKQRLASAESFNRFAKQSIAELTDSTQELEDRLYALRRHDKISLKMLLFKDLAIDCDPEAVKAWLKNGVSLPGKTEVTAALERFSPQTDPAMADAEDAAKIIDDWQEPFPPGYGQLLLRRFGTGISKVRRQSIRVLSVLLKSRKFRETLPASPMEYLKQNSIEREVGIEDYQRDEAELKRLFNSSGDRENE